MDFASPTSTSSTSTRSYSQSAPKSPGARSRGPVARDAAARDESLHDFADFIKSTGPDNDPKMLARSTSNRPAVHSRGGSSNSQQGGFRPPSKKITKPNPVSAPKKGSALPARTNSKLKARDPVYSRADDTSELADFLRSGPPGAQVTPQSVSSPQPNGRMGIGSGTSVASTQDSFAASKMTQSSTNSRTGLLDSTNRGP